MKTRLVYPEFFADEGIAALTPYARLLYVGLWVYADDDGRGEWLPKRIEGSIFPHETVPFGDLWAELENTGKVERYNVGGKEYWWLPRFDKWQKPKYKRASRIPHPELGTNQGQTVPKPGHGIGTGIGTEIGNGIEIGIATRAALELTDERIAEGYVVRDRDAFAAHLIRTEPGAVQHRAHQIQQANTTIPDVVADVTNQMRMP